MKKKIDANIKKQLHNNDCIKCQLKISDIFKKNWKHVSIQIKNTINYSYGIFFSC